MTFNQLLEEYLSDGKSYPPFDPEQYAWLRVAASQLKMKPSVFVRVAVMEYMKQHGFELPGRIY
jgi:hypothetical protein